MIVLDGKEPSQGGGQSVLTAVCVPSQYYLASAVVDTKTNEIPVAQKLFPDLDLKGRFVSLNALHTQTETARDIVLEGEGDYLLTVNLTSYWNERKAPETGVVPISSGYTLGFWRGREEGCQAQLL